MKPKWKGPSLVMAMVALTLATILSPAVAERRVALVVGNAAYEKVGVLYNPGNDARRIASTLRTLGFEIVGGGPLVDLNKAAMDRAVLAFGNAARDADVALFFYSGHGAQIAGTNYLVPTDGVLTRPADADFTMFNANLVMRQLEASRARLKMMILDACRNNPFVSQGTKDVLPGLAQMQAPAGTVIGFATQPGNVASDGPRGGNSPYTKALAAIMPLPGRELFTVFNDVGLAVMDATRDAQQPWLATSPIQGRFYFAIPVVAETESAAPVPTPVVLSPGPSLGHIQSAHRFLTERNYDAAHSVLSAAINLDRKWALPFSYRGFTWMIQGDERKDEALKINGRNDKKIALVNAAIEMYAKALIDLDRAIDLDPLYSPARRHRGNTIVAVYVARKSVGRVVNDILDKAILDLKTSASLDPKSKTAAHDLGVAYNYKGHYRLAIEAFNKAIQLNPKYAAPYAGRCSAWVMLGEIAKAKADATIAADLDDEQEEKTCLKGVTI